MARRSRNSSGIGGLSAGATAFLFCVFLLVTYPLIGVPLLVLVGWLFWLKYKSSFCDICNNQINRTSYFWDIEGQRKRVCPHCNQQMQRRNSREAFGGASCKRTTGHLMTSTTVANVSAGSDLPGTFTPEELADLDARIAQQSLDIQSIRRGVAPPSFPTAQMLDASIANSSDKSNLPKEAEPVPIILPAMSPEIADIDVSRVKPYTDHCKELIRAGRLEEAEAFMLPVIVAFEHDSVRTQKSLRITLYDELSRVYKKQGRHSDDAALWMRVRDFCSIPIHQRDQYITTLGDVPDEHLIGHSGSLLESSGTNSCPNCNAPANSGHGECAWCGRILSSVPKQQVGIE